MSSENKIIAVSLSGGLDSTVAAALLKDQGWTVWGVHLRLPETEPPSRRLAAIAQRLEVKLLELDLKDDFAALVIDYFVKEYQKGRIPNPCVRCNASIKFGRLWEIVHGWGVNYLATGHYVRCHPLPSGEAALFRGVDPAKDQSYFLHRLRPEILSQLIFPLGEMTKAQVLARARELGLEPYLRQPESQELCFIALGNYLEFLRSRGPESLGLEGEIVDRRGRVLGKHQGLERYTVGQRRGLGLPATEPHMPPYYVLEILPEANRVVVGPRAELLAPGLVADQINWLIDPPTEPIFAVAQIRYRHPGVTCQIKPLSGGRVEVIFTQPQAAVTPGQAVAFYQGDRVLGGGWIERRIT